MSVDVPTVASKIAGTRQRLYVLLMREYGEDAAKAQYNHVATELRTRHDLLDCGVCGVWQSGVENVNGQPVCWECEPEVWR